MAATLGWKGAVDTDLQFSEFYGADHSVLIWFLLQYPNGYAGPILAVNGTGNYLVGQGDRNTQSAPHVISRIEGAGGAHVPTSFDAGRWYQLAVVRTGSQVRIFLDGQPLGATLTLTGTDAPAGTLRVGRPAPGAGVDGQEAQFFGMVDELAVYTRAFTDAELQTRFTNHGHLAGDEVDLLAGWVFSPTPPTRFPAKMLRSVVYSGQTDRVLNSPHWNGAADLLLIPPPDHEPMELPFLAGEAWGCTQGFAQAFSHRGYAAFCWDFQKADETNTWTDEYPDGSFKAPIYATGDGEVILLSDVSPPADSMVPETENQLQIRPADRFTRASLHLLKNSIRPFEGQHVYNGQPVAQISTEWRAADRPGPHLHFAVNPDPADMIGWVTSPSAFSNYEVRNPDGSWSLIPRGIPATGQVVRRTGPRLWIVEARAASYTLLSPPTLTFKVISQSRSKVRVWIEVSVNGVHYHVVRSEAFLGPGPYVGDWDGRQAGVNTRDPLLVFWLGHTADGSNFFNVNGKFQFRIRAADDDGFSAVPQQLSATIRWHGQRISCVKIQGNRIAAVGGQDADRGAWQLTAAATIRAIGRGSRFYVETPGGDRVDVVAYTRKGRKYIKTVADGDAPNNLLQLPRCPPAR